MSCKTVTNKELDNIQVIADSYPFAISSSLKQLGIQRCRLSSTSYCNQKTCVMDDKKNPSIPRSCTCAIYTILSNMFLGMYQSVYCVVINQSSDVYNLTDQVIKFNIDQSDGENIENVKGNIDQTVSVQIVSLVSTSVQQSLGSISYQSIQNVLEQAVKNKKYFDDPISLEILEVFAKYGSENLQESVTMNISSTIQSMTEQDQTIILTIDSSTWNSLNVKFSQGAVVKILSKNITTLSLNGVLNDAFQTSLNKINRQIKNKYCYEPSKLWYLILLIFLLLLPLVYYKNKRRYGKSVTNIDTNINSDNTTYNINIQ